MMKLMEDNKISVHLFELYLHQISTDLDEFWCTRKQNTVPNLYLCTHGFGTVFCLCMHQTSSKSVKLWWRYSSIKCTPILLSSINFIIISTPQGLWERKGQKNPYHALSVR